jgi:hypothetical protein
MCLAPLRHAARIVLMACAAVLAMPQPALAPRAIAYAAPASQADAGAAGAHPLPACRGFGCG